MDEIKYWQDQARKFRNCAPWDQARKLYRAEHPLCEICEARGRLVPSMHIDHHTVPLWQRLRDGEDCFDRLRALCQGCHNVVTAAELAGRVERLGCDVQGVPIAPAHHWHG